MSSPQLDSRSGRNLGKRQIVLQGVMKDYDGNGVLKGIELFVNTGEIVVILGGSGAGKTTLLKLLIGLEKPSAGSIYIGNTDIVPLGEMRLNAVRRQLGMVFQYAALLDSLTVLDNVAFPLREHSRLSEAQIRERVGKQLRALGLTDIEDRFPSELSGGMRKRVGLARALMMDPEILLYDEPTSGLDPITSRQVDALIVETRDRCGVTSVVISHDMTSAMTIADYIYVLAEGRVAAEGTPAGLRTGKSELIQKFLSSSGVSLSIERTTAP